LRYHSDTMSIRLVLTEGLLVVVEQDSSHSDFVEEAERPRPHEDAATIEAMLEAWGAGTITKAELVDWFCLRVEVAERLGAEAKA
jgi:hypothetical protein